MAKSHSWIRKSVAFWNGSIKTDCEIERSLHSLAIMGKDSANMANPLTDTSFTITRSMFLSSFQHLLPPRMESKSHLKSERLMFIQRYCRLPQSRSPKKFRELRYGNSSAHTDQASNCMRTANRWRPAFNMDGRRF